MSSKMCVIGDVNRSCVRSAGLSGWFHHWCLYRERSIRRSMIFISVILANPVSHEAIWGMWIPRRPHGRVEITTEVTPHSKRMAPLNVRHTPLRTVSCSLVPQLVSRLRLPSADTSGNGSARRYPPAVTSTGEDATCFALCPGPGATRQAPTKSSTGPPGRPSLPRVVVGYSDGSIACAAMPPPISSSARSRQVGGPDSLHGHGDGRGVVPVRRLRRVSAGGAGVGDGVGPAVEAAVTAVCALSAPLVVAGDSDGRLGLWTVSSTKPPGARYAPCTRSSS